MKKAADCLSASLTLLVELGILQEKEILNKLSENSFEGLFNLLNKKYKEMKEE